MQTEFPNMRMGAFEAAAHAARLKLTKQYTTMPLEEPLQAPEAILLLEAIAELLKGVPSRHRRTWQKMLSRAFPELGGIRLDKALQKLVVRCWVLRASLDPIALHDFVEFCAGQGNLKAESLKLQLYGVALDIRYSKDYNMITRVGLRIMIDCISEAKPGALNWWGTQCSSFVAMSKNHRRRSDENGFRGNEKYAFVRNGNMMQVPSGWNRY